MLSVSLLAVGLGNTATATADTALLLLLLLLCRTCSGQQLSGSSYDCRSTRASDFRAWSDRVQTACCTDGCPSGVPMECSTACAEVFLPFMVQCRDTPPKDRWLLRPYAVLNQTRI